MRGDCLPAQLLFDAIEFGRNVGFTDAEHVRDLGVAFVFEVQQHQCAVQRVEPATSACNASMRSACASASSWAGALLATVSAWTSFVQRLGATGPRALPATQV